MPRAHARTARARTRSHAKRSPSTKPFPAHLLARGVHYYGRWSRSPRPTSSRRSRSTSRKDYLDAHDGAPPTNKERTKIFVDDYFWVAMVEAHLRKSLAMRYQVGLINRFGMWRYDLRKAMEWLQMLLEGEGVNVAESTLFLAEKDIIKYKSVHVLQGIDNPAQRKAWSNLHVVSVRVLRSLENLLEELDAKYHCVETVEIMLSLNGARASFGMAQVGATYKPNKKAKHAEPKA